MNGQAALSCFRPAGEEFDPSEPGTCTRTVERAQARAVRCARWFGPSGRMACQRTCPRFL